MIIHHAKKGRKLIFKKVMINIYKHILCVLKIETLITSIYFLITQGIYEVLKYLFCFLRILKVKYHQ